MVFVSVIYAHLPEFLMSPGGLSSRMRLWRIKVEQIVAKIKGRIVRIFRPQSKVVRHTEPNHPVQTI